MTSLQNLLTEMEPQLIERHFTALVAKHARYIERKAAGERGMMFHQQYRDVAGMSGATDEARTAWFRKMAIEAGKAEAHAFEQKLTRKLAGVEVTELQGTWYQFTIWGSKDGAKVRLEQNVIWKFAPRSYRSYNQFPARIYVDGKFTPEAKFLAAK